MQAEPIREQGKAVFLFIFNEIFGIDDFSTIPLDDAFGNFGMGS